MYTLCNTRTYMQPINIWHDVCVERATLLHALLIHEQAILAVQQANAIAQAAEATRYLVAACGRRRRKSCSVASAAAAAGAKRAYV